MTDGKCTYDCNGVAVATAQLLKALGIDLNDPNFIETPERVSRMFMELCKGLYAEDEIKNLLSKTFPSTNDEMIIQSPIKTYSLCPHHLLLVEYDISIGYLPKSKVLGLSKLTRLAELVTKKPALQEDVTDEITELLMKHLDCLGAICIIKGRHGCMLARGVKSNATTTTSSLKGVFKMGTAKEEFLNLIKF